MFRGPVLLLFVLMATPFAGLSLPDGPLRGPTTDSVPSAPRSDRPSSVAVRPLPFYYDLYTFRGNADSTTVVAAFAVPVERLRREREDRRVQYRFDVTLVLSDTALQTVSRTDDSAFVSVPRALAGRHLLFTHVEVQALPSSTTLHRVIMTDASTPGIGQLYSSAFAIPDYSGDHLMLSDIAMGQPGAEGGWHRGDVTLALFPTSQFPGSSFELYYEIYNLPFGHPYDTEVSIEPVDDSGGGGDDDARPVRIRFFGESTARADGSLDELRHVEASLANGHYRLTVSVTDGRTGQTAHRSRLFQVREWGRGATLVPALPARRMGGLDP